MKAIAGRPWRRPFPRSTRSKPPRNERAAMKVLIPAPLHSYTGEREVDAAGATIAELLADLDRLYPGLRFRMIDEQDRMRAHIRFFVNGEQTFDMARALSPADSVQIVQALSGGEGGSASRFGPWQN